MATEVRVRLYPQQDDFVFGSPPLHRLHRRAQQREDLRGERQGDWNCATARTDSAAWPHPNFPMLEHGAKFQFLARLDESGRAGTTSRARGRACAFREWNAEIIFVTLESESRVRGPNYAWGWADEVEYVTDRKIWRAFKGAVRDGDTPQLFVTSTPKGRRLVWDEWVIGATAHHALYKATTYDNPFIDAARLRGRARLRRRVLRSGDHGGVRDVRRPGLSQVRPHDRPRSANWSDVQSDPAARDRPQVGRRLCLPELPRRRRGGIAAPGLPHPGRTHRKSRTTGRGRSSPIPTRS
jgi:hypothetical protein